jgi:hypothetical protein
MSQWSKVGNIMGPSGPAGNLVAGEIPTGMIDGTNNIFNTALAYLSNSLGVYLNGLRQRRVADYTETSSQAFQFVIAPWAGSTVSVDYMIAATVTPSNEVIRETPSGTIDGANVTFILNNDPKGTEQLYLNGLLQEPGTGNDYTISGKIISMSVAPKAGGRIKASYYL